MYITTNQNKWFVFKFILSLLIRKTIVYVMKCTLNRTIDGLIRIYELKTNTMLLF